MNTENTTATTAPVKVINRLSMVAKTNLILRAWGAIAPENKLAGLSLNEFRTATAATLDTREQLLLMKATRRGAIANRNAADKATAALLVAVASGVKADPSHGVESSLYRAMGFVPASERKTPRAASSGSANPSAAAPAAAVTPTPAKGKAALNNLKERVNRFLDAWAQFAPESSFGGQFLAGFTAAVAPSRTVREEMAKDRISIAGTIAIKNGADRATGKLIQRVVSAIRSDADFGTDSDLYRALGYVTASERRTGKQTRAKTAPATIPAV